MKTEEIKEVICCFCGEGLGINSSIQISFWRTTEPIEVQGLFSHSNCFDEKLHKSIPRNLTEENDDN